jgi:hypothetical protein
MGGSDPGNCKRPRFDGTLRESKADRPDTRPAEKPPDLKGSPNTTGDKGGVGIRLRITELINAQLAHAAPQRARVDPQKVCSPMIPLNFPVGLLECP